MRPLITNNNAGPTAGVFLFLDVVISISRQSRTRARISIPI